ncbi:hypothetical protein SynRS9909_00439 [Synechococcus sp. RS9909]|nr:hypothetical protein SynRS9909_00439 [Synechococcus sp. RS9909]
MALPRKNPVIRTISSNEPRRQGFCAHSLRRVVHSPTRVCSRVDCRREVMALQDELTAEEVG